MTCQVTVNRTLLGYRWDSLKVFSTYVCVQRCQHLLRQRRIHQHSTSFCPQSEAVDFKHKAPPTIDLYSTYLYYSLLYRSPVRLGHHRVRNIPCHRVVFGQLDLPSSPRLGPTWDVAALPPVSTVSAPAVVRPVFAPARRPRFASLRASQVERHAFLEAGVLCLRGVDRVSGTQNGPHSADSEVCGVQTTSAPGHPNPTCLGVTGGGEADGFAKEMVE